MQLPYSTCPVPSSMALRCSGGSQAKQVVKHLKGLTFEQVDVVQDLAGVDRFVTAYRAAAE